MARKFATGVFFIMFIYTSIHPLITKKRTNIPELVKGLCYLIILNWLVFMYYIRFGPENQ